MAEPRRREARLRQGRGALNTGLESLALEVLDDNVNHCVADAMASGDEKAADRKTKELLQAVQRFARTRRLDASRAES